jgi:hypothetical protein
MPALIDKLNRVAIGAATAGKDSFNSCNDTLSTLQVAGDASDLTALLTSSANTG